MVTNLSNSTDCNLTTVLQSVNPWHLYQAFGHWLFIFYSLVIFFLMVLWSFSLMTVRSLHRPPCHSPLLPRLVYLTTMPAHFATLTAVPLFFPSTLPFVSQVQEIITVTAMLSFVNLTLDLVGGVPDLILNAAGSSCPLGTPPCCCLRPCQNPKITPKIIHMIVISIRVLITVILIKSFISICQVYSGVIPVNGFYLTNLPEFLSIPFFMSCMYSYKVFISITGNMLPNTWHKLRGIIVFFLFIISKGVGGIMGILEGQSVFDCIPPTITPSVSSHLLTATIQFSFSTIMGLVLSRIYKRTWKVPSKNTSDDLLAKTNGKSGMDQDDENLLVANNRNSLPFIDEHVDAI